MDLNTNKKGIQMDPNKPLAKLVAPQADDWKFKISYRTVLFFIYHHISAIYGLYLCFAACWATIVFGLLLLEAGMLGVMAGAHRLWAHRSYKAKPPLQVQPAAKVDTQNLNEFIHKLAMHSCRLLYLISSPVQVILMLFQSLTGQYTALNWARDHRLHHKHSDTDADPHNATRGFFFSHMGWLLVHKHPEIKRRGPKIDLADLMRNPVLIFQKKHGFTIITLFAYVLPTLIPIIFWNETLTNSWHLNILRIVLNLNFVSLINSVSHAFGNRPYDKEVQATENFTVNLATLGEGFHNYHHVFPWDYRAAELYISKLNLTAAFIEFFAWVGWAYDLKTVEYGVVVKRAKRRGDGTYKEVDGK